MKTSHKIILILAIILLPLHSFADAVKEAEEAYKKGDYENSVKLFQEVLKTQGTSAGLLFDLGNAYFKASDEGNARLCYERALKLSPGNPVIKENLQYVAEKINDQNVSDAAEMKKNVLPDSPSFIQSVYAKIAIDHNSNMWAVLGAISFLLFLGGLALYMFTPNVLARKTGFFSGIVFLAFSVCFLIFSYLSARHFNSKDQAILIEYTSQLLKEPLDGANPVSSTLHKGTKVEILEEKSGNDGALWYKVRLNSENIGWVKSQFLEVI